MAVPALLLLQLSLALKMANASSDFFQPVLGAVGRALRARTHRVGLGIVEERFFGGVPTQLAAQLHGNPGEDARASGAVSFFRGRYCRPAGLDAGEPVEVVVFAFMKMDFAGADVRFQNLWITGGEGLTLNAGGIAGGGPRAATA